MASKAGASALGRQGCVVMHAEILPSEQSECLKTLGPAASALGFHLAAMKLLAVAQRGTKKDFIDLHALSRQLPLTTMLDCYRRRFGVSDTSRVLAGLCYFDDAENEPSPVMLVPCDWETVKNELREMVRRVASET